MVFSLDKVLGEQTNQKEVYDWVGRDIVESVLNGFNGTILAYGQTASGKTHTMVGNVKSEDNMGIIPRSVLHMMDKISFVNKDDIQIEYSLKMSTIEIYNEQVRDLLAVEQCPFTTKSKDKKSSLKIIEDKNRNMIIVGLTELKIDNFDDFMLYFSEADGKRTVESNNINAASSRSHLVIIITVSQYNKAENVYKCGKLY